MSQLQSHCVGWTETHMRLRFSSWASHPVAKDIPLNATWAPGSSASRALADPLIPLWVSLLTWNGAHQGNGYPFSK